MSNSSSVGGPGGAGASPYTSGTPDNTDQTGQTNDHRKVTVNPNTGQPNIPGRPDDSDSPPPSPLTKRKVAHHTGSKKLKPMPNSGDGFKPLGGGNNPAGNGATPTGSPQRRDSLTGQVTPQTGVNPQVSVESLDGLTPLPPLTPDQQEQKNKLAGAFKMAFSFVKAHKNSFAMGGGLALMIAGIALMAFPPTAMIGVFPAVFGFVALTTGFSFAMMNNPDGGAPTPPPDPSKTENDDEKKKDKPGDGSEPSSSATPKGHFAKIDHTTGAPVVTVAELSETEETSAEAMARKREMLNLQRHMELELKAAFDEEAARKTEAGSVTTEASLTSKTLEDKIFEIAAEYAVRAGLNADDDVVTNIVESGKVIARAMAEMEGMSQEERQAEFQKLFASLAQRPGIPSDAIRMLCGAFDGLLEKNGHLLNEAVKAAVRSTSALLKAFLDGQKKPSGLPKDDVPRPKPVSSSQPSSSSDSGVVPLVKLETLLDLDSVHDPDNDLKNIHHIRQLQDAIEAHGRRISMAEQEIDQVKTRLFNKCRGLLNTDMDTPGFKAALVAEVDPVEMPDDRAFLDKALSEHKWFNDGP